MRSALVVAGLEVELVARSTDIEAVISTRYAPFLGAPKAPLCSVFLETASPGEGPFAMMAPAGADGFDVVLSGADLPVGFEVGDEARIQTAPTVASIDGALHVLFSFLAVAHDAVLLDAGGAIVGRSAHVYAGGSVSWKAALGERAGRRPLLSLSCVAIRDLDGRWTAAATPFGLGPKGSPRQAPLTQLWVPTPGPFGRRHAAPGREQTAVIDAILLPSRDPGIVAAAERIVRRMLDAVPCAELPALPPAQLWSEMARRASTSKSSAELSQGQVEPL